MNASRLLTLLTVLALLALAPGCSKSDTDAPSGAASSSGGGLPSFDLTQIQNAFASATGPIKAQFDTIVTAIKSQDYSGALKQLQAFASDAGLSADQKSAVNGLIEQVKAKAGSLLQDATAAAGKAVDQAKEAAGKAVDQAKETATKAAGDASKAASDAADAAKKSAGNLLPK